MTDDFASCDKINFFYDTLRSLNRLTSDIMASIVVWLEEKWLYSGMFLAFRCCLKNLTVGLLIFDRTLSHFQLLAT